MIVAAGMTPAWQQIMVLRRLTVGQVHRAEQVHWCASGKVLNAAIALKHLGADCSAVSIVGGAPAPLIGLEMRALGVELRAVQSAVATRVCTTILESDGRSTELVENARAPSGAEIDEFLDAFASAASDTDVALLIGSLPLGVRPTMYREMMDRSAAAAIIDARGEELLAVLPHRPFLVKPNRDELAHTLRRSLESDAIRYGLGAAAANAGALLPARLDPEQVARMANQVRVEQL